MLNLLIYLAPKSPLFEWGQGVINPDLGPQDCTTIYSGSVAAYNASYLTCQCDASSFVSPDRLQCCKYFKMWRLNIIFL